MGHRRFRGAVAILALALAATAAPAPALASDDDVAEHSTPTVDLGTPAELERTPSDLPITEAPTGAQTATGFHSSRPGEISWLPKSNRFSAAGEEQLAFVEPNGAVRAVYDAPGRIDHAAADDTDAFIKTADRPNRIQRIDALDGTVAEFWDIPETHTLDAFEVTPTTIWFSTFGFGLPYTVGSIDRATGAIELDRIDQHPVTIVPLESAGLVLVDTYNEQKLWDVTTDPATVIAEANRENIREFLTDGAGTRLFSVEREHLIELSLTDLSHVTIRHTFQGDGGGGFGVSIDNATMSPDTAVVVLAGWGAWPNEEIQTFAAGGTTPVMQHDPGFNADPSDLAASGTHVALWVPDPNGTNPLGDELNVYPLAPTPLSIVAPTDPIEAGYHTSLSLNGDSLGATTSVTLDGVPTPFGIEASSTLVVTLPDNLSPGRHALVVTSRFGSSSFEFDTVQQLPRWTWTPCPEMTDSISRLYRAYFLREPEEGGFVYWLDLYASGDLSLAEMSQYFAESREFELRYGGLGTGEFLDLVYRNVLGRTADAAGRAFWAERLEGGDLTRGELMLSFSESREFVAQTATAPPFAGFFTWYGRAVTFTCGTGNQQFDLQSDTLFVDVLAANTTAISRPLRLEFRFGSQWGQPGSVTIEPGAIVGFFGLELDGDANRVRVTTDFDWAIVESPVPLHTSRSGWTD